MIEIQKEKYREMISKFEFNDDMFINDHCEKEGILHIAHVEMDRQLAPGSWEAYFDCIIHCLKVNFNDKTIDFLELEETASFRDRDCDCRDNGYDYNEEESYIADTWYQLLQSEDWKALSEIKIEDLDGDVIYMIETVEEILKEEINNETI